MKVSLIRRAFTRAYLKEFSEVCGSVQACSIDGDASFDGNHNEEIKRCNLIYDESMWLFWRKSCKDYLPRFTGFFILQDVNPIFQPIIEPEETIGPHCFKFGMEVLFDILF